MPVSGWQGIRAADTSGQYLITGTSGANGFCMIGPISGVGGTAYSVNYPGAATTSVYGPDNLGDGEMRLVGSYTTGTVRPTDSSSRGRSPISRIAVITARSRTTADDANTLTFTARWATWQWAMPTDRANQPIGRTTRSFTASRRVRSDGHRVSGFDNHRPMAFGTTAARATRSAAATTRCRVIGRLARGRLSGQLQLRDRAIHALDIVQLPEWRGRPGPRHSFSGDQQCRGGRLHALAPIRSESGSSNARPGAHG